MRRTRWVIHAALLLATAPWPQMRLDDRNTARSPVRAVEDGTAQPWQVQTDRGVFASPVIDRRGTSYIGSADGRVYAIDGGGGIQWTFRTGGPIDAAGALIGNDLVVGSGDGRLYRLRTRPGLRPAKRVVWRFKSPVDPAAGLRGNGWDGSVSRSPDGDLLAGTRGGGAHKVTRRGRLVYVRRARDGVFTAPATGRNGTTYWGSLDGSIFALNEAGGVKWSTRTRGFVTAPPTVGDSGTVYGASYDGKVYALDPATGAVRWTVQTGDAIDAGPALSATGGLVVASTDGSVYGITGEGAIVWRFDTGEPVRSSPVIGVAADGREVAYVGSANGKLYALDVLTGDRRWSFDTTPSASDRNDLSSSPALGAERVIVGSESGAVWGIPYGYCERAADDARCDTDPDDDGGPTGAQVLAVTPGGTTFHGSGTIGSATALTTRLIVRDDSGTLDAGATQATVDGGFPATTTRSGDGRLLHVLPDDFLAPDTAYAIRANGTYAVMDDQGATSQTGAFDSTLNLRTAPLGTGPSLAVGTEQTSAFVLSRFATAAPSLLASVDQAGLDATELIAGLVGAGQPDGGGERRVLLWVIGGRRQANGTVVPAPARGIAFALPGRMRGDQFIFSREDLTLRAGFGDLPVRRLELRGGLDESGTSKPGAALYAEVDCATVPRYAPVLLLGGFCDAEQTLVAAGTFAVAPYANATRPRGVSAGEIALTRPTATRDGSVTATLGGSLKAARHSVSILLTAADATPVALDYPAQTTVRRTRGGDVRSVTVRIPAGTQLPDQVLGAVMTDAFPLSIQGL